MKCPSCASTISGVYEAGDYTCSGCSAQLRINPVTRTKSKPKQSPHSQAQKRARKTARAGSMSGDEAGAYPSFKMRKDHPAPYWARRKEHITVSSLRRLQS